MLLGQFLLLTPCLVVDARGVSDGDRHASALGSRVLVDYRVSLTPPVRLAPVIRRRAVHARMNS